MSKDDFTPEEREEIEKAFRFLATAKPRKRLKRDEMPPQKKGDKHRKFRLRWGENRPEMVEVKDQDDE